MAFDNLPELELPELQPGDEVIKEIIEHSEATNERSTARRLALQVLYEIDSTQHPVGEVMNAQVVGVDQPVTDHSRAYLRYLVNGVMQYRIMLDDILHRYAPEFPLAQIAIVDRNILRIAALEFALYGTTPVGVAIDEAVELAKLFGAEGAPRFINGVLGALADDQETLDALADMIDDDERDTQTGSQNGVAATGNATQTLNGTAGEYPPTEDDHDNH
jgi:N utilization substance protein B